MSRQSPPLHPKPGEKESLASRYDRLFKENMRLALPGLLNKILKLPEGELQPVPTDFQRTRERKTDFIGKLVAEGQPKTIVHVEFQHENDRKMPARQFDYAALIHDAYPDYDLIQIVFFLGKRPPTMANSIRKTDFEYRYRLVWIKDFDYRVFLETGQPELMLLATLANYGTRQPGEVMEEVILGVRRKVGDGLDFERFIEQLRVLSGMHTLQQIFKTAMLNIIKSFDPRQDAFFQDGLLEGELKGKLEGRLEGILEGELKGELKATRVFIFSLLHSGLHSDDSIAKLVGVPLDVVLKIKAELEELRS